METDKQRKNTPISNRFAPQDDLATIAAVERFISDSKIQKDQENTTEKHKSNAGYKVSNLMIHVDSQRKINQSMQNKVDKSAALEELRHRFLSSASVSTPNSLLL